MLFMQMAITIFNVDMFRNLVVQQRKSLLEIIYALLNTSALLICLYLICFSLLSVASSLSHLPVSACGDITFS